MRWLIKTPPCKAGISDRGSIELGDSAKAVRSRLMSGSVSYVEHKFGKICVDARSLHSKKFGWVV